MLWRFFCPATTYHFDCSQICSMLNIRQNALKAHALTVVYAKDFLQHGRAIALRNLRLTSESSEDSVCMQQSAKPVRA